MKRLFLSLSLIGLGASTTLSAQVPSWVKPSAVYGAAALTWAVVSPTTSYLMNTTPFFHRIGYHLLGNAIISRAALAGIVAGTLAGAGVVKALK